MKKKLLTAFILTIFLAAAFGTFVYGYTVNSLTRFGFNAPAGIALLTDSPMRANTNILFLYDNNDRNVANLSGNARIRYWESDILYVVRAPELIMQFNRNLPAGTEFQIRLHNLAWFFRSADERYPYILAYNNYSGGIERLFPTSYNRNRGLFVPNTPDSIGGVYTRRLNPQIAVNEKNPVEVSYELIISDYNDRLATIVLLNDAYIGNILRIPIVAKLLNPAIDSSVEVIGNAERSITSGIYRISHGNPTPNLAMRNINSTFTRVPSPQSGTTEIWIPEIVITENTHGVIRNGALILSAPEGFIIVPDVDNDRLGRINSRILNIRNEIDEHVINLRVSGGLYWRNRFGVLSQDYAEHERDFRLRYRNPAGDIDASQLLIEFKYLVESRFRNPGHVIISGLRLVAVDEVEPGPLHMRISQFNNMDNFSEQYFYVGTIVGN